MSLSGTNTGSRGGASRARIGYYEDITTRPLTFGIDKGVRLGALRRTSGVDEVRELMATGELEVALMPAWDFLKVGRLSLIDTACISTVGTANVYRLCSKVLPTEIRRVLVDHESYGGRSLAEILLPAQTANRPEFVRSEVPLDPRRFNFEQSDYDAFLIVGENAILAQTSMFNWVYDLGHGWASQTNTPLVMHVWACRRGVDLRGVDKELADVAKNNAGSDEMMARERERLRVGSSLDVLFKRILRTDCGPLEITALRTYSKELARNQIVRGMQQFQVYRPPVNLRGPRVAAR